MSKHMQTVFVLSIAVGCSDAADSERELPSNRPDLTERIPVEQVGNAASKLAVSYLSGVEVPHDNQVLEAERYLEQIALQDPLYAKRCPVDNPEGFGEAIDRLGGIRWSHPVNLLRDAAQPPLYTHRRRDVESRERLGAPSAAGGVADSEAPTIERPDLVGLQGGVAIFLSKAHGLLAVNLSDPEPTLSCAVKLPGTPRYFFYKGDQIVLVVNGGLQQAALLRFRVSANRFSFVDSVFFEDQQILDARLFNRTLVTYSEWYAPLPEPQSVARAHLQWAEGIGSSRASAPAAEGDIVGPVGNRSERLGTKLHTVQWNDSALTVDWEESFDIDEDDEDPLYGRDPSGMKVGDLVSERTSFKPFISASDAYLVVTRDIRRTYVAGFGTYTYGICTDWNPQYRQVKSCRGVFERRPNPDYRPPDPLTGDYSCDGQRLEDCLVAAAPRVSQHIWVRTGTHCDTYWRGRCEAREYRSVHYPKYRRETSNEFLVFRYVDGDFVQLDENMHVLDPNSAGGQVGFDTQPLELSGIIGSTGHLRFQQGHFYVLSDGQLQTLMIRGNSALYLRSLPITGADRSSRASFTRDRLYVSSSYWDRGERRTRSDVVTVDLTNPSLPSLLQSFDMPGANSQLILSEHGVLGPGQVSFTSGDVRRNLQKLTLFSRGDGSEVDNLLLGTDYDSKAWLLGSADDQRIRLHWPSQHLFTPYAGRHHTNTWDIAYRTNITQVQPTSLLSLATLVTDEPVQRTVSVSDSHALAFGENSAYSFEDSGSGWASTTIEEVFVPSAAYRFDDSDRYVRIARFGNRCRVSTHDGIDRLFTDQMIESTEVFCRVGPIAIGNAIVFRNPGPGDTGVTWQDGGVQLRTLSEEEIPELLERTIHDTYCFLDPDYPPEGWWAQRIYKLEQAPDQVYCEPIPEDV